MCIIVLCAQLNFVTNPSAKELDESEKKTLNKFQKHSVYSPKAQTSRQVDEQKANK